MSTLLGNSAKPTVNQEWFGASSSNQHATVLTLPAGGPYLVTRLGGWFAGKDVSVTAVLCIWDAGGTLLSNSFSFTATSRSFGAGQSDNYERDISPPTVDGGDSVYVGFSRNASGAAQFGTDTSGNAHLDDTDASSPANLVGGASHSTGTPSFYLYYEAANDAPNAPTLNDPTGGELVASQTPTLNFTPDDPDGDDHTGYTYQVDNNSDFSSPVESTEVTAGAPYTDGVAINRVVTSTLTRGTTYYWRVKTKDAANGYGAYSAGASFKIAVLPTASVTAPVNAQTAELYFTAGTSGNPKIKARWSYSCTDGHAQERVVIRIYADSGGSPGSLLNTDTYTGTATSFDTTYAVVENTKYHVSVQPRCSLVVEGVESSKNITRTRWARASYYFDSGSTPVTLSSAADTTVGANQTIVLEYTATGSSAEPGTWYANISSAGLNRFFWHRATMFAWGSATPTSPKLNSVTFTYSSNSLTLDNWTVATGGSVDTGTYVYGTQSLKHATSGSLQRSYQIVPVTADTQIVLSGRARTLGTPAAELRIEDVGATTTLASVSIPNGADWARYKTPVIDTGSATSVRVSLISSASGGSSVWFDAIKLEASTVVTPWTPGFIASAVALDAGGIQINGQGGGVLRYKGITGGTRDIVEGGATGLKFGGVTSPVNLYSPSADLLEVDDDFSVLGGTLKLNTDVRLDRTAAKTLTFDDNAGAALTKIALTGATALEFGGDASLSRSAANALKLAAADRFIHDFPGCIANRTSTQSIPASTWTEINFDATDISDQFGFHDPSTNNSRFIVPTGWGGTYLLTMTASMAAFTGIILYGYDINAAGTPAPGAGEYLEFIGNTTIAPAMTGIWIAELAAADYVEFAIFQNNAGAQNTGADIRAAVIYLGETA